MQARAQIPFVIRRAVGGMARLWRDRRGVAAVEFAFIAPVLLVLYFVTMEVSQAIEVDKKVGRIASLAADLVTQQQTITKSEIDAIMQIGGSVVQPYDRSQPTIILTAIQVSNDPSAVATVVWSRELSGGATSQAANPGTTTTVPAALDVAGSFLIRAQATLNYLPVLVWSASAKKNLGLMSAFDNINMGETYYLRPRMSTTIPCSDC